MFVTVDGAVFDGLSRMDDGCLNVAQLVLNAAYLRAVLDGPEFCVGMLGPVGANATPSGERTSGWKVEITVRTDPPSAGD